MANILNSANLLKLAMSVIPPRSIQYYAYKNSTVNAYGELICTYELPITLKAVVIEENMNVYQEHGLSPQKMHKTIYVNHRIQDTANQNAADMFYFDNEYWRVISTVDWTIYNGWSSCIVSKVKETPFVPEQEITEEKNDE
ncbi:MAG: hypothetical protein J6R32_06280 [Bacteroidales bacterium]|nr:hypothetical protein [Bacteroidales bacterium]